MTTLRFKQVDVFTSRPFFGNPVAVVIGAEGLDTEAMQRIACWTNLSETTFLLASEVADYKLRIFTPRQELPFAGHPTVGSCHAALESGFIERKAMIRQECAAGILDLALDEEGRIFVKGPPAKVSPAPEIPNIPTIGDPLRIDIGSAWIVGELSDAHDLAALAPDMASLSAFSLKNDASGITLFARSDDCVSAIHVRSFAPAHGIPEDPVCGVGNLSVGAFLKAHKLTERIGNAYVARQGAALGRDGRVHVRLDDDGIRIGGHAVTCVDGTLRVD